MTQKRMAKKAQKELREWCHVNYIISTLRVLECLDELDAVTAERDEARGEVERLRAGFFVICPTCAGKLDGPGWAGKLDGPGWAGKLDGPGWHEACGQPPGYEPAP